MHFEMFGASVLVGMMAGWPAGIVMKGGVRTASGKIRSGGGWRLGGVRTERPGERWGETFCG